jgi:hypothetical protein
MNLIQKLKALRGIPGFHSLCLKEGQTPSDFEVATQILSVCAYRKRIGPMTFFGNTEALKWLEDSKIAPLYDEVLELVVDPDIDQKTFWAAGKIEALRCMTAPCIGLDTDCVLFRRPTLNTDVVALHSEPFDWQVYQSSPMRDRMAETIFGWYAEVYHLNGKVGKNYIPPANCAVVGMFDEGVRLAYVRAAERVMLDESEKPSMTDADRIVIEGSSVTEMVLAEQLLLSWIVGLFNKNISFIGELDVARDHMVPNPDCYHLWNSKRFYRQHSRAREHYIEWVMERMRSDGLLDKTVMTAVAVNNLPTRRVVDGNTGAVRWSHQTEWTGPGEIE